MKIAVIGSGISGLGAAYILSAKHEVHLFESESRLGGHAHTSTFDIGGKPVSLDTGFLVYNDLTYPHLRSMFKHLNVEVAPSDMSLSIQVPQIGLEWAGDDLTTVYAQKRNFFSLSFQKMLLEILKFHRNAENYREVARLNRWTMRDLLDNYRYSPQIVEWYILPMVAAIWSTPEVEMFNFPAETFLTFFLNHKLLQVNDRPQWKTVRNGSRNYVSKIAEKLKHIHLSEPVLQTQHRADESIQLRTAKGEYTFDKVIFATRPDMSLKIMQQPSEAITGILKNFSVTQNTAVLHQDESLMPKSKKCWASWCVQANLKSGYQPKVALTYYLNRLQPLNTSENIFLTLNPDKNPQKVLMKTVYQHPRFDQAAIDAQKHLPSIQGLQNYYHIGAWSRYGFHEDGLLSAVQLGELLGCATPWKVEPL